MFCSCHVIHFRPLHISSKHSSRSQQNLNIPLLIRGVRYQIIPFALEHVHRSSSIIPGDVAFKTFNCPPINHLPFQLIGFQTSRLARLRKHFSLGNEPFCFRTHLAPVVTLIIRLVGIAEAFIQLLIRGTALFLSQGH